jgi:hypothetical protein
MLRHTCLRLVTSAAVVSALAAPAAHATDNYPAPYDPAPRTPVVVHHSSGDQSELWPVIGVGTVTLVGAGLVLRGRVQFGGRAGGARVAR